MTAFNPSQPYAEDFADIRADAIEALNETRAARTHCEKRVVQLRAELQQLESTLATYPDIEDGLLRTLAKLERYARGDFDGVQPDFPNE